MLVSFLIGAVSCVFTGLGYSEFAARVPVAGSAYTYAYTSFGELLAWIIGWNLTLEYGQRLHAPPWATLLSPPALSYLRARATGTPSARLPSRGRGRTTPFSS